MQITDAYRESLPFAQKATPKSKTNETGRQWRNEALSKEKTCQKQI